LAIGLAFAATFGVAFFGGVCGLGACATFGLTGGFSALWTAAAGFLGGGGFLGGAPANVKLTNVESDSRHAPEMRKKRRMGRTLISVDGIVVITHSASFRCRESQEKCRSVYYSQTQVDSGGCVD
jgi:hypothetical protein